jgi:hypothetical protein
MKSRHIKPSLIFLLFLFAACISNAQVIISGTITDEQKKPVPFAGVTIKGTYDGASSDENGSFKFKTTLHGKQVLVVSCLGFEPQDIQIEIGDKDLAKNVVLKEKESEQNTVIITAGSFEASDKKRATILKPLDIVSTAGASGDINGALKTLPGAQQIGETEGLFVRGGTAGETKTIIDEMVVQNPYFSSIPDVPQRGRFSPFLFTGTVFSTGGYSAMYGQALSSTLNLSTDDLAAESSTGIGLTVVGASLNHTERWKNTQLSVEGSYSNLQPFFLINRQNTDWVKTPESVNGSIIFRQKTSETGMFKFYGTYSQNHSAIKFPNLSDPVQKELFDLKNQNFYLNSSYRDYFGKWGFFSGASYSKSNDNVNIDTVPGVTVPGSRIQELAQVKSYVSHPFINNSNDIKFGAEAQRQNFTDNFGIYKNSISETYGAVFAESDLLISKKIAARVGARAEYSKVLDKFDAAPRVSLAYKTGKKSQVSLAYGDFYETPDRDLLYLMKNPFYKNSGLGYEMATHYILNYQYMDDDRTFRVEGYYKKYKSLVRVFGTAPLDSFIDNSGNGYADGIDVFWRDKKTIKHVDYWISYSYLDTKRLYRRYENLAMPTFAATHTFVVVYKQAFPAINSAISATYTFATGRPYYNPGNPVFLGDRSINYNDFSLGYSYLTQIKGNFTVIFVSLANVPNFKNIYGYRYSNDGKTVYPIIAPAGRTFFVGMFIAIGRKAN